MNLLGLSNRLYRSARQLAIAWIICFFSFTCLADDNAESELEALQQLNKLDNSSLDFDFFSKNEADWNESREALELLGTENNRTAIQEFEREENKEDQERDYEDEELEEERERDSEEHEEELADELEEDELDEEEEEEEEEEHNEEDE